MGKDIKQRVGIVTAVVAAAAVVLSPAFVSAATDTQDTTINATIASMISLGVDTSITIPLTPGSSGSVVSSRSDAVSVSTNNASGYVLTLANVDATSSLVHTNTVDTITAHTGGTPGAPTALATNTWGYRVDGVSSFGAGPTSQENSNASSSTTWARVPVTGSPDTLKTTATTASADTTTVWYGVNVNASKPTGTYSDVVRYTATTN